MLDLMFPMCLHDCKYNCTGSLHMRKYSGEPSTPGVPSALEALHIGRIIDYEPLSSPNRRTLRYGNSAHWRCIYEYAQCDDYTNVYHQRANRRQISCNSHLINGSSKMFMDVISQA